jgi:hypothetical protein
MSDSGIAALIKIGDHGRSIYLSHLTAFVEFSASSAMLSKLWDYFLAFLDEVGSFTA